MHYLYRSYNYGLDHCLHHQDSCLNFQCIAKDNLHDFAEYHLFHHLDWYNFGRKYDLTPNGDPLHVSPYHSPKRPHENQGLHFVDNHLAQIHCLDMPSQRRRHHKG